MSFQNPEPLRVNAGHSPIFQAGQTVTVWRVRQGLVRLVHVGGPSRLPVQIALAGDLIGIEALAAQPCQFDAEAFTACELEPVDPACHDGLMGVVMLQQQRRSHDMAALRTGSVLQRLSHLLRLLGLPWQGAHTVDSDQADAVRASLPPLREVAELVDAKTETVCRALAQLLPPRSRKGGPARKPSLARPVPMPRRVLPTRVQRRPEGAWSTPGMGLGVAA